MFFKSKLFQTILVCFFISFILMLVFYPVLFGNKVFFDGDLTFLHYPISFSFDEKIDNLDSFFWSSEILSGFPQYASIVDGFFYFLNILFHQCLDFLIAYHWLIFVNFLLGGLFTYLFIKNLGLSKIACLISVFTYILSQWLISNGSLLALSNFYFILPALFLSLLKISQKKYWYILLGGIVLGLGWLSSHPQFIVFICLAGFFYALFLDYLNYNRQKSFFKNFITTKVLIIIGLISLIIGFVQLFPSAQFSDLTARSINLGYQKAAAGAFNPIQLISYFFPNFHIPHLGWGSGILYIGFLPLVFILITLFYHQRNKNILFFLSLFFFGFLTALPYSPIFWLMYQIPFLRFFRGPGRWVYVVVFASAILVAYGYEYLLKNPKHIKKLLNVFKYIIYFVCGLVLIGNLVFWFLKDKIIIFLQNYFDTNLYEQTTKLPLEYYHNLIGDYVVKTFDNINLFNYKFLIPFAFILLGYYLISVYVHNKINLNKFKYLVLCFVVCNFLLVYQGYYQFIPKNLYLKTPQTVEFIKSHENNFNDFRIFSFMPGFSEYQKLTVPYNPSSEDSFIFTSEMITPNLNVIYGLHSIDGYEAMMSKRKARILSELGGNHSGLGSKLAEKRISLDKKIQEFLSRINLLEMQNVKYIISAYQLDSDKLNLVSEIKATRFNLPIYVYENLNVLPRIYFAENVQFIGIDEIENLNLLLNPNIDFNQSTLIECLECESQTEQIEKNNFSEINIEEYRAGLLRLKTKTNQDQWLVFSESNLPIWQATINSQVMEIYTANYLYQSIKVPAGEHLIEFKYKGITGYENLFFN